MTSATLIALSIVLFGWAIVSERLALSNITGPLLFLVAGLLLGNPDWGIVTVDVESSTVHGLAELTLALLLFADASGVPLTAARRDLPLTARLLGIGLPLSIVAGTALALVVFPSIPLALAGLIAAALAPTDAALSAAVIGDDRLPARVRRVLNVESGLNDGIATPVVTFCIASAATVLGIVGHHDGAGIGALGQLVIGIWSAPASPTSVVACSPWPTAVA
jgi:NhaP-type Na+/H+ or K+/H+ antiporter